MSVWVESYKPSRKVIVSNTTNTYRTIVRYSNGRTQTFDVSNVPDDLVSIRRIVHQELQDDPPIAVLILVPNTEQPQLEAG